MNWESVITTNRPVADILSERLWNTILLIGAGQILSIIIGVIFGVFAAWKARTSIDYAAVITSLVGLEPAHLLAGNYFAVLGKQ